MKRLFERLGILGSEGTYKGDPLIDLPGYKILSNKIKIFYKKRAELSQKIKMSREGEGSLKKYYQDRLNLFKESATESENLLLEIAEWVEHLDKRVFDDQNIRFAIDKMILDAEALCELDKRRLEDTKNALEQEDDREIEIFFSRLEILYQSLAAKNTLKDFKNEARQIGQALSLPKEDVEDLILIFEDSKNNLVEYDEMN